MAASRRLIGTVASAVAVIAIGWIDYITGPDIGLTLLYLIPVAVSAWFGGISSTVFIASAAGAAWLAADLGLRPAGANLAIPLWNAFTRLVIYISEGVFIALLHRDRELLRAHLTREKALARTDHATSLPNMRGFLELVEAELHQARAHHHPVCAIYIDLDNFKAFNDHLGHAAGDDLLDEVGKILSSSFPDAVAARLGGDEFAVLLRNCTPKAALEAGEKLIGSIRKLGASYPDLRFGATAGIGFFRDPPRTADDLVRAADDAMYAGKESGKGRVSLQNL